MQRFRNVGGFDDVAAIEIGDRAGDFDDFEIAASAKFEFIRGTLQKSLSGWFEFKIVTYVATRTITVVFYATFISRSLNFSGGFDGMGG